MLRLFLFCFFGGGRGGPREERGGKEVEVENKESVVSKRNATGNFPCLKKLQLLFQTLEGKQCSSVHAERERERERQRERERERADLDQKREARGRKKREEANKNKKHGEQNAASAVAASASPSILLQELSFVFELAFFARGEQRHDQLAN